MFTEEKKREERNFRKSVLHVKALRERETGKRAGGESAGESSPKACQNTRLQTDVTARSGGTIDAYIRNLNLNLKVSHKLKLYYWKLLWE